VGRRSENDRRSGIEKLPAVVFAIPKASNQPDRVFDLLTSRVADPTG